MKHKFKPSIGGNRVKRGAVGGGRKEEQTPRNEKSIPTAPAPVDHQQGELMYMYARVCSEATRGGQDGNMPDTLLSTTFLHKLTVFQLTSMNTIL